MPDLNDLTIKTYKEGFAKYTERTVPEVGAEFKEWMDCFLEHLPEAGSILELGSATGRDARYFRAKGFKVSCTDVIPEALQKLKEDGFEVREFDFRDEIVDDWLANFDGFFANAVFLHAPQAVFEKAIANILKVLKKNGVAAFSLKLGEGESLTSEKMDAPRYFNYHSELDVRSLLTALDFEIIRISQSGDGKWLHVIVRSKV